MPVRALRPYDISDSPDLADSFPTNTLNARKGIKTEGTGGIEEEQVQWLRIH